MADDIPRGRWRSRSAWSSLDRGPGPSPIGDILRVAATSRCARRVVRQMATAVKRRQMFIGGEWVSGSGSESQNIINPATGEVIAEVPKGTEADVDRAVKAARKAYTDWFETVPKERSEMLRKLAEAMLGDAAEAGRAGAKHLSTRRLQCHPRRRRAGGGRHRPASRRQHGVADRRCRHR